MTTFTSNRQPVSKRPATSRSLSLKRVNAGLFAASAAVMAFYLITISDLTVQGFVLRDLKTQASTLAGAVAENEAAVSTAQSYGSLSGRVQKLSFVAVDSVEYLTVAPAAVARK